jgi:lysine-N-methylase
MYFVFTYFCGAVYDADALSKIKLSLVSVLLIRELDMAVWLQHDRKFTLEDQIAVAHRYAREVEHSDPNKEALESMAAEEDTFCLEMLLLAVLGIR